MKDLEIYLQLMPGIAQNAARHLPVKGTSKPQPKKEEEKPEARMIADMKDGYELKKNITVVRSSV